MLANAMILVALMALAANTILSAGLISKRIAIRQSAQTYLSDEYRRAVQALVSEIVPFASGGSFPDPLPAFSLAPACVNDRDPCGLTSSAEVSAGVVDSGSPEPCDPAAPCANNEQQNVYVLERRVVAKIAVSVQAADGTILAARASGITLRTLRSPPYVVIAGARDEDAGRPPATANPCTPASPGTSPDTVVRVALENAQSGACSDGSAWRSSAYSNRGAFDLTR